MTRRGALPPTGPGLFDDPNAPPVDSGTALGTFQPAGDASEESEAAELPDAACPLPHCQLHHLEGHKGRPSRSRGGRRFGAQWQGEEAWVYRDLEECWEVWGWCGGSQVWLHLLRLEPGGTLPLPVPGAYSAFCEAWKKNRSLRFEVALTPKVIAKGSPSLPNLPPQASTFVLPVLSETMPQGSANAPESTNATPAPTPVAPVSPVRPRVTKKDR